MPSYSNPDYNPSTWALGYQTRQFGVAVDPPPAQTTVSSPYPSVYSALANPPANMTASITQQLPLVMSTNRATAPAITPTQ